MEETEIELMPSQFFYSQNNIYCSLTDGRWLGDVLDRLIDGKESVRDLGLIRVTKRPGSNKWYSLDNRRLWLFHHLQGAGKCKKIPVVKMEYNSCFSRKFTSRNGGVSIKIRDNLDVFVNHRPTPVTPCYNEETEADQNDNVNSASSESVITSHSTGFTPKDDKSLSDLKEGVLYERHKTTSSAVSTTTHSDARSTPANETFDVISKSIGSALNPAVSASTDDDTKNKTKVVASDSDDKSSASLVYTPLEIIDRDVVNIHTHVEYQDESVKMKPAQTQNETTADVPTPLAADLFTQRSHKRSLSGSKHDEVSKKLKK